MISRLGCIQLGLVALGLLAGCSGSGASEETVTGTVALPLVTYGPSGTTYRLRNAVFELSRNRYYELNQGTGGAYGGIASTSIPSTTPTTTIWTGTWTSTGTTPPIAPVIVNSEDQPDAESLTVELEQGDYIARLLPGWSMEKIVGGVAEPVEAQLLSGESQWIWVSPHATSWVSYQFGIGDYEMWFNGNVNINIQVYENPEQYYGGTSPYPGTGGSGGYPAAGGAASTTTGTWVSAGGGAVSK
jgi:hypothetical protein